MEQGRKNEKPNFSYLNYLRFGSILLVILLHSVSSFLTDPAYFPLPSYRLILICNEVGRAGVPLFFMMSGFLLLRDEKTCDCIPFYRRRLTRILIPLVIWNGVYCVHYGKGIAAYFSEMIHQGSAYHLWFLYTLLGIYLFAPFLKRIVDNCSRGQLWWLLALISFAGTLRPVFNLTTPFYLYLFPSLMEGYIAYFLFGYLLGTMPSHRRECTVALCMAISGFIMGICGNYFLSSQEELLLPFNSGYSLNHFLLAGGIFLLARNCRWMEHQHAHTTGRLLAALTFQIYFVHVLIMDLTAPWIPDAGPVLTICVVFLVTAVGSILLSLGLYQMSQLLRIAQKTRWLSRHTKI